MSYKNGTKQFEGKNVFTPGVSPRLCFDVAALLENEGDEKGSSSGSGGGGGGSGGGVVVIAGGPCSGKSTLCSHLQKEGYQVVNETAEMVLQAGVAEGRTAEDMRSDAVTWQMDLLQQDFDLFHGTVVCVCVCASSSSVYGQRFFVLESKANV